MQMILPAAAETAGAIPRRRNSRMASRAQRNWPVRLTPMTVFHSAKVMSWIGESRCRPALATRMSSVPNSLDRSREHRGDLILGGDVRLIGKGVGARLANLADHGVGRVLAIDIVDHHIGAGLRRARWRRPGRCRNSRRSPALSVRSARAAGSGRARRRALGLYSVERLSADIAAAIWLTRGCRARLRQVRGIRQHRGLGSVSRRRPAVT